MAKEVIINNIESLIKVIEPKSKQVKRFRKFDGITLECYVENEKNIDKAISEIQTLCNKNGFVELSVEKNDQDEHLFIIQFPNMDPVYTADEISEMYNSTFKFLLDNLLDKESSAGTTKQFIKDNADRFVKMSILAFYRSNVNRYKYTEAEYVDNLDYRKKITVNFLVYLDKYWEERYNNENTI